MKWITQTQFGRQLRTPGPAGRRPGCGPCRDGGPVPPCRGKHRITQSSHAWPTAPMLTAGRGDRRSRHRHPPPPYSLKHEPAQSVGASDPGDFTDTPQHLLAGDSAGPGAQGPICSRSDLAILRTQYPTDRLDCVTLGPRRVDGRRSSPPAGSPCPRGACGSKPLNKSVHRNATKVPVGDTETVDADAKSRRTCKNEPFLLRNEKLFRLSKHWKDDP